MNFFEKRYVPVDKAAMEEGAPIDFGDGFTVNIRHVSSEKVSAERGKITQKLKVMNRNKELTPEQQKTITHHVAAHAGIAGWSGGGVPEFSPEFAMQVFNDRPEFLEDVLTAMTEYEAFRKEEVDAVVGNLETSSTGA